MSLRSQPELQRGEDECRLAKGDENIAQFLNLSSFAEYMLVHEHTVAKIREDMSLDIACVNRLRCYHWSWCRHTYGKSGSRQYRSGDWLRRRRSAAI